MSCLQKPLVGIRDVALTSLQWPLLPLGAAEGSSQGGSLFCGRWGQVGGPFPVTAQRGEMNLHWPASWAHCDVPRAWSICRLHTKSELRGWQCKKKRFSKAHPLSKGTVSPRGGKRPALSPGLLLFSFFCV